MIQWIDEGQEFQAIPIKEDTEFVGTADTYFHSFNSEPLSFNDFIPMIQDVWGDFRPKYGGHTRIIGNVFDNPELLKVWESKSMQEKNKTGFVEYI